MDKRIETILNRVTKKEHHRYRQDIVWDNNDLRSDLSHAERVALRLKKMFSQEKPVLFDDERIAFMRTVKTVPPLFSDEEMREYNKDTTLRFGFVSNICPDYSKVIASGLAAVKDEALRAEDSLFYRSVIDCIDTVLDLCDRYAQAADRQGLSDVADRIRRVTSEGAGSFLDALQLFRIVHYTLWCEFGCQVTIGRFDQYMLPYLQNDLAAGVLTEDTAYELLLEFFISFNKDNDLYPGVQKGDNGQSLMLGGLTPEGEDGFNVLSKLCLRASCELKLIDPKINLRVHKDTPLSVYELGTELTRAGLGFPQYSNDEVVIDGLCALGYALADARNYTVAACWEYIIPGVGMEVPNVDALSFPSVINAVLHKDIKTFDELLDAVDKEINLRCEKTAQRYYNIYNVPAPFTSIFMGGMASGKDISEGSKYNNYGVHGTGLSTAADSLAALKEIVWDEKSLSFPEFAAHVANNFAESPELLTRLRYEMPKMGQNNDKADEMGMFLLNSFAKALEGKTNARGGIYRAGTGSAMYYLWHANELGASPDGRLKGELFSANYAPSLFAKIDGPLSVIQSFTKPDLRHVINGGPLTMEFHEGLFSDPDSISKVAMLVKSFIDRGGHQMQLNTVNREMLLDAQKNPAKYQNVIVRIWGWSAYFVELDKDYQDHVLARQEYMG